MAKHKCTYVVKTEVSQVMYLLYVFEGLCLKIEYD